LQNEAVVTEVIRRAEKFSPGSLELVNIHNRLPGLKSREGLTNWNIYYEKKSEQNKDKEMIKKEGKNPNLQEDVKFDDLFEEFTTYDERAQKFKKIRHTMFPEPEDVMKNSIKI
jgi:hypothetical protein